MSLQRVVLPLALGEDVDTDSEGEGRHGDEPASSGVSPHPSSGVALFPSSGVVAPPPPSSGVSLLAPPSLDSVLEQPAFSTQDWWLEELSNHGRMNGPSNYEPHPAAAPALPAAAEDAYTRSEEQQQRHTRSRSRPRRAARSSEFTTNAIPTQSTYEQCACRVRRVLAAGRTVYLGITENYHRRWEEHSTMWDYMVVLFEARTSQITGQLERQLLSEFRGHLLCQNYGPGGERASCGSPHYLYMVVRLNGLVRRR